MSVNQVSPSPRVKPDSDMEVTEITEEELNPGKETDGKHVEHDIISRTQTHVEKLVQNVGKDMEKVGEHLEQSMKEVGDHLAHGVDEMTRFISGKPPAEDAEIEPDETFYMSKAEIVSFHKEARKCAGRAINLSPETAMMIFDILFFSTYAIGWIITLIFNFDAINDNAVTRVTGKYNICIGVDSYPARYLSIPMSYCFTIAFCLTCVLFMKRMLDQREWSKRCSKVWRTGLIVLAFLLFLSFSWTIGVMPVDAPTFRMHLMGFLLALGGYSLMKLISIIEFGYFADDDDKEAGLSCKDMCQTWRKCVFLTFEGACCLVLATSCVYLSTKYWHVVYSWPVEKVEALLNTTVPTNTQLSYNTMPVLFFCAVCPLVAKIIDPHRRHILITFKYMKPTEKDEGEGIQKNKHAKCQDQCLDKDIPCSCCWKEKKSKVDVAGDDSLIQRV